MGMILYRITCVQGREADVRFDSINLKERGIVMGLRLLYHLTFANPLRFWHQRR
jgi:hypothetical protein